MPKIDIDYSNTIIYKIICRDSDIKHVYVGHTTNFVQRKHAHKQNCININSPNYNIKLYTVIRANGGWNNWKMEIINFFDCKDHYDARKKEQEYFISLNANLNSIEPMPKPKVIRNVNKTETEIKNSQIITNRFVCIKCEYSCNKQSDFSKHLGTAKHSGTKMELVGTKKIAHNYCCKICNKNYKTSSGLWKHSKICTIKETEIINNKVLDSSSTEIKALTNIVLEMVKSNIELQKQHNDLQKQMVELCKSTSITNNNNINNHSNNKTFNLQFFLNEQCKDAMNISDFANSFDLQLSDLESVGDLGYVEGITKIMIDKLNSMDIYKRPIHCSDLKRETLYVKDDNKWEKEQRNNPKLRYAVKTISFRNMKLAVLWSETYPESKDCDSHANERYMKLIKESTGGSGDIVDNENKIIRRIAKEIVIDKM